MLLIFGCNDAKDVNFKIPVKWLPSRFEKSWPINKRTRFELFMCVCNGKLSIFAGLDGVRCLREEDEARKLQAERWRESGLGQGLLKRAQRVLTRKLLQLPSCNEASRTKRTCKFFPQSGPRARYFSSNRRPTSVHFTTISK